MKIAIDGPGAAGKSTVAKLLAHNLGMTYIDTGAMYRAIALGITALGIFPGDAEAVGAALDGLSVGVAHDGASGEQLVYLNGEDVTGRIRTPEMSKCASDVSKLPSVRLRLVDLQREIAEGRDVIMDGRDIGTYVFPDADRKYFLTASPGARARRRYLELRAKGGCAAYGDVLRDLVSRDANDSGREMAPLTIAPDAVLVETDDMTALEVEAVLRADILKRGFGPAGAPS